MSEIDRYLPLSPQQFQILLALTDGSLHGYGVIVDIAGRTGGRMRLGTGTLYTAIGRLLSLELIGESRKTGTDTRRRYYQLTPLGRRVMRAEASRLESLVQDARAKGIRPRPARLPS